MKTYLVYRNEVFSVGYQVDANSPEEAVKVIIDGKPHSRDNWFLEECLDVDNNISSENDVTEVRHGED